MSRSNLGQQLKKSQVRVVKRSSGKKIDCPLLLKAIKSILSQRPSYGYRRVTAYLRALSGREDLALANHKRVYRVMKQHQLLMQKPAVRPLKVHEGKIITLHSNMRWCSDSFCIPCDHGDRLQVAFSLDTCDREVMGYVASTKGIDQWMIQDLMAETVFYRFGTNRLPDQVQWLTDNGSCYTAYKTVEFGRSIGLEICTTRPYSPESNGMAEAFVKTFKRDYVAPGDLSSATAVSKQLPAWFEDYNVNAPHKGLQMMSPRAYILARKKNL